MGGASILGTLMMGIGLLLGDRLLPGSVLAWFSAPDSSMEMYRFGILAGVLSLAVIREYSDSWPFRLVWAIAAVVLVRAGVNYFLDHAEYVLDALFMLAASACFGMQALQTTAEQTERPLAVRYLQLAYVHARNTLREGSMNNTGMPLIFDGRIVQDASHRLQATQAIRRRLTS